MFIRVVTLLIFTLAPLFGLITGLQQKQVIYEIDNDALKFNTTQLTNQLNESVEIMAHTESTTENVYRLSNNIYSITRRDSQDLEQGQEVIQTLLIKSEEHKNQSLDVLDQILKNILGDPIDQTFTDKVAIKVFSLKEAGYRGYMAKVKIFDPEALKLVMAHDQIRSNGETTSSMAKRKGAILAINAGGFWTDENGKFAPVGTTVVDGEIKTFSTSSKVSFVGFNNEGRLIGGKIESREHLESMDILQGASFLPTLLKDGQKMPIPAEWANQKHPRTLIGHFENGDLLMIVIDGRRQGWSTGVTLEEAQDKLLEFNVRDAYNLDGGGSSTFFYKGEVLNKPSDGRERPVISSFVIIP